MPSQSRPQASGHQRPPRTAKRSSPLLALLSFSKMMPSKFNIIRAIIYSLVFLWTIICLAIAAHFQSVLAASDLTRFVPFAIFVSSASMVIILVLSAFSVRRNMNPISTRIELGCLGLVGTFWIALGAFLASSDSETASVECFESGDSTSPVDGGFSTDTYQAQYRVLEAFSLFNAALVWGFLLLLFGLAMKHYMNGHKEVWQSPVTTYDWFGKGGKASKLPAPVTARPSRSRSKSKAAPVPPPDAPKRHRSERSDRSGHEKRPAATPVYAVGQDPQTYYVNYPSSRAPARAHTRERNDRSARPDYYRRDASPRR
ncbi:hypothetical protein FA95DRAFT_1561246 [Auriscalpium vulgare]|uniref:Uncharacterized protein n=1 Tax=Auriscalpium vulgare TaxID=40419 RepID=A0ACB8RM23_9AGAM|nr:hypothetical protein FA95DRAFT_1561246 [Auriscalpium vulgare]